MKRRQSDKARFSVPVAAVEVAAYLLLLIAVTLFWWLGHVEILYYQEQYQMFQTTGEYLADHLAVAGGVSVYVSEFLTQFNLYPFVGALFIAIELTAIAFCVVQLCSAHRGNVVLRACGLVVGAAAVWLLCWMMGDENLLPSFPVAVLIALIGLNIILVPESKKVRSLVAVVVLPLIYWCCATSHYRIPHRFLSAPGFIEEKTEVLLYDKMVRQEEWTEIIKAAEKKSPTHPLGVQALNLALAQKRWLGDRMFAFKQIGTEGLLSPWRNNCVDCVISSEVAWHVGLVNTAFRYSFDSQEAIPDKRKSARLTKRMAECCIVNGDYRAAHKYLNRLSHTLLYSKWAARAEKLLGDDNKVAMHPVWGEKRNLRFKTDYLFNYPEQEKMYALLATESNGRNTMAWDYFNAAVLLKGDLPTFAGMSHYSQEMFHQTMLPRHQQEAWALYWTSTHPTLDGIPVAIATDIQQRIQAFAQQFMKSKGRFDGFEKPYDDTYWVYFLKKQQAMAQAPMQTVDGTTSATALSSGHGE